MIMKENDIINFVNTYNQSGEMSLVGVSATSTKNIKNMIASVVGANFGGAIGGAIVGSNPGVGIQCILSANNNRFVIGFFATAGSKIKEIINIFRNDIAFIEVKKILFGQKISIKLKDNTTYNFNISNNMMFQPNHKQRLSELLKFLSI